MRTLLWLASRSGIVAAIARRIGLVDLPAFSPRRADIPRAPLAALPRDAHTVLLLPDPYTSLFDTRAIDDVAAGLVVLGYRPLLLPLLPAACRVNVRRSPRPGAALPAGRSGYSSGR